jgi:hypothetical protein
MSGPFSDEWTHQLVEDRRAPKGKFRVLFVDMFSHDYDGWRDFDTLEEAKNIADLRVNKEAMATADV